MIQVLEGCWAREGGNTNLKSGTTNWGRSHPLTHLISPIMLSHSFKRNYGDFITWYVLGLPADLR